jgi:hypothetical protein
MSMPTKPTGWKGSKTDSYWTHHDRYGYRAMCTTCGKVARGFWRDNDRAFHKVDCPRIAGPRKEWKAYVDRLGAVGVVRHTIPQESCHLTRDEALVALDRELAEQIATIERQRSDVARLLANPDEVANEVA